MGALVTVVCAGAFTLVYLGADGSVPVVQVVRPVAAGQQLSAEDVRVVRGVVRAGQDVDVIAGEQVSQVLGRSAAVPLAAGSLLAGSQLGPAAWPPPGQAVTAVALKPGRVAAGISAGSRVLVIPVTEPDTRSSSRSRQDGQVSQALTNATVVSVDTESGGSQEVVVSLLLPRQDALRVAATGVDVSLALAQD